MLGNTTGEGGGEKNNPTAAAAVRSCTEDARYHSVKWTVKRQDLMVPRVLTCLMSKGVVLHDLEAIKSRELVADFSFAVEFRCLLGYTA